MLSELYHRCTGQMTCDINSVGQIAHDPLRRNISEVKGMVLYGKAGPAIFQQWMAVNKTGEGGTETRQKVYYYTVSLPDTGDAVKKLMGGCKKQGPEIKAGVDEDLLAHIQKYGGAMKFDGELPRPPNTS